MTVSPETAPPSPPAKVYPFQTEVAHRRPQVKMHTKEGHVKLALGHHGSHKGSVMRWVRVKTVTLDDGTTTSEWEAKKNYWLGTVKAWEFVDGEWVFRPDLSFVPDLTHRAVDAPDEGTIIQSRFYPSSEGGHWERISD